ncbi:hypothetical protein MHK07_10555 [Moraxella nonliquefaciens]|nr:hypothetical protein [Moraxella nonliquefaciens]
MITTEFGKEAPKAVAKFADKQAFKLIQNLDELNNKNIDITSDEYQNTIKEIDKWSEGGIYRVALHTAVAALATGTAQGGLSAGTTAYTIPKIDEYLKEQGFDETVRHSALLALSAGIGATVGDSTASTVNNVGQVQWNYLSHRQLQDKISCVGTKKDCAAHVAKYDEISRQQDEQLKNTCSSNPNSTSCHLMIQDALEYVGKNRNHYGKASDIKTSTQNVLSVANSSGYHTINSLDERANYFGAMYGYTDQPWFRVAENESRGFLSLKGADKSFYSDWIAEAGGVIMRNGRSEFQYIYNNHVGQSNSWSYGRLVNEQHDRELQAVHERHYNSWKKASKFFVDSAIKLRRRSKSGDFLNPNHRVDVGCEGMKEVKECQ